MTGSLARACTMGCECDGAEDSSADAQLGRHHVWGRQISIQQLGYPDTELGKQLLALHDAATQYDALGRKYRGPVHDSMRQVFGLQVPCHVAIGKPMPWQAPARLDGWARG